MNNCCYFETFAQAIDGAIEQADRAGALLTHPAEVWDIAREPLNYGLYRTGNFQLELYRERPTKKYFHVVIYRLDSGRYELTTYVL